MGEQSPKPALEYDRTTTVVSVRGPASIIDYQPDAVVRRARLRRQIYLLLAGALALALVFPAARYASRVHLDSRARQLAAEQQAAADVVAQRRAVIEQACMTFTAPPDKLVYHESPDVEALATTPGFHPVQVKSFMRGVPSFTAAAAADAPQCWKDLEVRAEGPIVFLHERKTPSGRPMIVCVDFRTSQLFVGPPGRFPRHSVEATRSFAAWVYAPGAPRGRNLVSVSHVFVKCGAPVDSKGKELVRDVRGEVTMAEGKPSAPLEKLSNFSVYAGQPDPADPSHFTIEYIFDGNRGTIDGWLGENDHVALRPREGRTLPRRRSGTEWYWDPQADPERP